MTAARRRLSPDTRRQQLVEVALDLFSRQSYEETDLEQIASAAGVRRGLLYHYFPGGKEELYVAVLHHAWGLLVQQFDVDPSRSVETKLPANLSRYLDLIERNDPAVSVVRQARRLEAPGINEAVRDAVLPMARGVAFNHLGTADPPAPVLSAILGHLGLFEVMLEEWQNGNVTREQLEVVVAGTLPAVLEAARAAS